MSEQKPEEEKQERSKSSNTDLIWFYYAGLVMVFIGLSIHCSIAVALIAVGAFITLVSLINSYLLLFLRR